MGRHEVEAHHQKYAVAVGAQTGIQWNHFHDPYAIAHTPDFTPHFYAKHLQFLLHL